MKKFNFMTETNKQIYGGFRSTMHIQDPAYIDRINKNRAFTAGGAMEDLTMKHMQKLMDFIVALMQYQQQVMQEQLMKEIQEAQPEE